MNMPSVVLVQATVKYESKKVFTTEDGRQRCNAVVTTSHGEEVKLWGNPGDPITYLKKGQSITLVKDSKGYKLVGTADPEPAPNPEAQRPAQATPEIRATTNSLSADVKEWLEIYSQLEAARPDLCENTRRAATSTLFIARLKLRAELESEAF